jgi:predicted  nucleic acid-binding Zn-ribbon protein
MPILNLMCDATVTSPTSGHTCHCGRLPHTGKHSCPACGVVWADDEYPIIGEQPACGSEFFRSLSIADDRITELESLRTKVADLTALNDELQNTQAEMLAQTDRDVVSAGICPCGSVIEIRDSSISVTAEENAAAAAAVAELRRRGPLGDDLDARIVGRVIDAINHTRASQDDAAMRDWQDAHADCGDRS